MPDRIPGPPDPNDPNNPDRAFAFTPEALDSVLTVTDMMTTVWKGLVAAGLPESAATDLIWRWFREIFVRRPPTDPPTDPPRTT